MYRFGTEAVSHLPGKGRRSHRMAISGRPDSRIIVDRQLHFHDHMARPHGSCRGRPPLARCGRRGDTFARISAFRRSGSVAPIRGRHPSRAVLQPLRLPSVAGHHGPDAGGSHMPRYPPEAPSGGNRGRMATFHMAYGPFGPPMDYRTTYPRGQRLRDNAIHGVARNRHQRRSNLVETTEKHRGGLYGHCCRLALCGYNGKRSINRFPTDASSRLRFSQSMCCS